MKGASRSLERDMGLELAPLSICAAPGHCHLPEEYAREKFKNEKTARNWVRRDRDGHGHLLRGYRSRKFR